jgi:hypothetical protein
MDREALIEYLIDSDFKYIMENSNGPELLDSYLGFGFKGYNSFTDDELLYEYNERKWMEKQ